MFLPADMALIQSYNCFCAIPCFILQLRAFNKSVWRKYGIHYCNEYITNMKWSCKMSTSKYLNMFQLQLEMLPTCTVAWLRQLPWNYMYLIHDKLYHVRSWFTGPIKATFPSAHVLSIHHKYLHENKSWCLFVSALPIIYPWIQGSTSSVMFNGSHPIWSCVDGAFWIYSWDELSQCKPNIVGNALRQT